MMDIKNSMFILRSLNKRQKYSIICCKFRNPHEEMSQKRHKSQSHNNSSKFYSKSAIYINF